MRPSIYWPLVLAVSLFGLGCSEPTALYCDVDADCVDHAPRTECSVTQNVCVVPGFASPDLLPGPDGPPPPDLLPSPDLTEAAGCVQTSDCVNDDNPVCGASGQCEPCDSALDDAICALRDATTPRCRIGVGTCAACREAVGNTQSDDCAGATTPVCTPEGACRSCRAHAECDAGICDLGEGGMQGRCVPESEIIHVDNRDQVVATCKTNFNTMQNGTAAEPYCDIDQAIDAVVTRPVLWLKVTPHNALYGPLDLTNVTHGTVVIHGPGSTIYGGSTLLNVDTMNLELHVEGLHVGQPAGGQPCVISTRSKSVTLKDVAIEKCTGNGIQMGVSSSAGGTLRADHVTVKDVTEVGMLVNTTNAVIVDSEVTGSGEEGMRLLGNNPLVDRSNVAGNAHGGIEVGPISSAVIQNSVIRGNGNSNVAQGVTLFGGVFARGTVHLINSTLDSNEADKSVAAAGLRCVDANGIAFNTVFLGNDGLGEISSACTAHASAFVGASGNGNVDLTGCLLSDVFTKVSVPVDLHPNKSAKDGCKLIDLGLPAAAGLTAPTVDFAGAMRPQGGGYDIGAFESTP